MTDSLDSDFSTELGSVAGPVIQANGRLTFENELRLGGLKKLSFLNFPSLQGNTALIIVSVRLRTQISESSKSFNFVEESGQRLTKNG